MSGYTLASTSPQHRVEVTAHSWGASERGPKKKTNLFIWERSRAQVMQHGADGHEGDISGENDTAQARHSCEGISPGENDTKQAHHSCQGLSPEENDT
ncbi:uncharacterized protein BO88DRAFT_406339 [Aspergillus vadensis CBS 113365]|uniref:Uncharacterized protein n=1 Tax=Aspergillus vadensis (strain CBS 113365 / IMI 142717 / IBT 24658) TaxID=1448311 RepID=A0A319B2U6_ASPVC|nr:hypothetical protein BO88DRAFT_406339 [Aspergillus vadensis CBS 113365]PYH67066.1 hypothetical protein BO88DRAFT_406339 [Aspergillus vadensis CBS 113365]